MNTNLYSLKNKVVLITGASSGIGLAIAKEFMSSGAKLLLLDRDTKPLSDLREKNPRRICTVVTQVQERDQCFAAVQLALEQFDGIDVLINSAGVNTRMLPEEYEQSTWDQIIDINLGGTFNMCQAVFHTMKDRGGGKIINIGSILSLVSNAYTAPYSASKGGVLQLTKSLACAWAKDSINVNAILPGWIDTPLSRQAREDIPGHAERVIETTPLGRWGVPEDVVGAALFLATKASDFVTGTSILVDGGVTAQC